MGSVSFNSEAAVYFVYNQAYEVKLVGKGLDFLPPASTYKISDREGEAECDRRNDVSRARARLACLPCLTSNVESCLPLNRRIIEYRGRDPTLAALKYRPVKTRW